MALDSGFRFAVILGLPLRAVLVMTQSDIVSANELSWGVRFIGVECLRFGRR